MPLCSPCRAEAEVTRGGECIGGERPREEYPPYGLAWGETCDRCGNIAEVTI